MSIKQGRVQEWIQKLAMQPHPEGGWFSEVYAAPDSYGLSLDGRVMGGSIYFLLEGKDVSHFHVIDCEELWYYHEGCGVEIDLLFEDGSAGKVLLGTGEGMLPMVAIPKGVIFGARNVSEDGYTLMSCATMPNFHYEGFWMKTQEELLAAYPKEEELIRAMAFEKLAE